MGDAIKYIAAVVLCILFPPLIVVFLVIWIVKKN